LEPEQDSRRTADGAFVSLQAARDEFTRALAGVDLSTDETRTLAWLLTSGDQPTLHSLVTLFDKLRKNPQPVQRS